MVRSSFLGSMGRMVAVIAAAAAASGEGCGPYHYDDVVSSAGGAAGSSATGGGAGGGTSTCGPRGDGGCGGSVGVSCDGGASHVSECLVDDGLVARYFLDDFTNGELADSGPEPKLPLQAVDPDDVLTLGGGPGHLGLRWTALGLDARVNAGFSSESTMPASKMLLMNGELTIETVVSIRDAGSGDASSRIVFVGTPTGEFGKFSLSAGPLDATGNRVLQFYVFLGTQAQIVGQWSVPSADLESACVLHLVLNTASSQVDLHVNGELLPNTILARPPSDYVFTWTDPLWYLVLGNTESGGHSLFGSIDYAALYSRALPPDAVKTNTALLKQSDDGPE